MQKQTNNGDAVTVKSCSCKACEIIEAARKRGMVDPKSEPVDIQAEREKLLRRTI
jgi:hypothetical protein